MGWFGRGKAKEEEPPGYGEKLNSSAALIPPNAKENLGDALRSYVSFDYERLEQLMSSREALLLGCAASFLLGLRVGRTTRSSLIWQPLRSSNDIRSQLIGSDAPLLRGRAVTVTDGDTIRFWHQPTWFHRRTLSPDMKMSDVTIPVRICTIDTPEIAKFGKPGQPYGEDAKKYLESLVLDQAVKIRVLEKDQYGRAVASVQRRGWLPFTWPHVDVAMLKAGLAEVYQGGGAVYGPRGKQAYLDMEAEARKSRIGIWKDKNRESASEFKARMK